MGRISSLTLRGTVFIGVAFGLCQGYYISGPGVGVGGIEPYYAAQNQVPVVYSTHRLGIPYNEQGQPIMGLTRTSRSKPYQPEYTSQSRPTARLADEEEYAAEAEIEEEPSRYKPERKKQKKKKDSVEKLSLPRRIFKKTTSAIKSTTKAVFGAPKYIYTRYRDTYGPAKKSEKSKKKKGSTKDEGWGWEEEHDDKHGWDAGTAGTTLQNDHDDDKYYRDRGYENERYSRYAPETSRQQQQPKYKYKRYLYSQPDASSYLPQSQQQRRSSPISALSSWAG